MTQSNLNTALMFAMYVWIEWCKYAAGVRHPHPGVQGVVRWHTCFRRGDGSIKCPAEQDRCRWSGIRNERIGWTDRKHVLHSEQLQFSTNLGVQQEFRLKEVYLRVHQARRID